jgi:hypothetical protein
MPVKPIYHHKTKQGVAGCVGGEEKKMETNGS